MSPSIGSTFDSCPRDAGTEPSAGATTYVQDSITPKFFKGDQEDFNVMLGLEEEKCLFFSNLCGSPNFWNVFN